MKNASMKYGSLISITMLAGFISLFLVQDISVSAQTRSSELPQVNDRNLEIQEYVSGFKFPTGMSFLGPDNVLILEKNTGIVMEIRNGTVVGSILDVNVANVSERGLLGIAVSEKPTYVF